VTSNSITIGATVPLSGLANSYAEVSAAANAVFKYVNTTHGGVNGRKINYIRLDDCYDIALFDPTCSLHNSPNAAQLTQYQTQQLASQPVFATVGSLGTSAQDSVLRYLNNAGIPTLFVNSGAPDWNQPSKYKDTFGYQTSYISEGKIFASYIKANFHADYTSASNNSIGWIGQSDFGPQGLSGLEEGGITPKTHVTYSDVDSVTGSTSDIATDVAALQSAGAKVVVLDSIPAFTKAILHDAQNDSYNPHWIISSVGSDPVSVADSLEVGAQTLDFFPSTSATTTWNTWLRKVLSDDSTDFPSFSASTHLDGNEQYGASYAVAFIEAVQSLGANVTRAGLLSAMTKVKFATPSILPLSYSGSNHQGLQGGTIATVASNGNSTPWTVTENGTIYTTTDASSSAVKTGSAATTAIPSYVS
jgi:ABC-type branched-subunit amino acid transport system substrate-binding protein